MTEAPQSPTKPQANRPPAARPKAAARGTLPLRFVRLDAAVARLVDEAPPTAMEVLSMQSPHELRFLYGLAKHYYRGEGVIVDAGIFLGASTRCFADGLRENPYTGAAVARFGKPIVSYEKASTNPTMVKYFERTTMREEDYKDTFAPTVRANITPAADLVDLQIGDVMQTAVGFDKPIEICFLDILKLPEINDFAVKTFFPRLIPGRTIVIQQDYFFEHLPYIKTAQEFLREHFDYLGEIGSTAVFLCSSAIPQAKIAALLAGLSADEQLRLAAIAMQRSIDPCRRFMMAVSKLKVTLDTKGLAAAQAYWEAVKSNFPEQIEDEVHGRMRMTVREAETMLAKARA